jgi:hypothetical protein
MAKTIREGVGNFSECDIPVVQRFEAILQWLEMEFSALPSPRGETAEISKEGVKISKEGEGL